MNEYEGAVMFQSLDCISRNTFTYIYIHIHRCYKSSGRQCHWADGRTYKGEWANGKAHGYGVEIRPDGSIRHDGEWQNDNPVRK
jgi:hypothetical protein